MTSKNHSENTLHWHVVYRRMNPIACAESYAAMSVQEGTGKPFLLLKNDLIMEKFLKSVPIRFMWILIQVFVSLQG